MKVMGTDVHLAQTQVWWLEPETGETSDAYNHPTVELAAHLAALPGERKVVVMEAGSQSAFLARKLSTLGCEVHVVDPFKARRLFEALYGLKKTDKLDARGLAQGWAAGQLQRAEVWVPDAEQQARRELTRSRQTLVESATRYRVLIRQLLARENRRCPHADLLGPKAQEWLDAVQPELPAAGRQVLAIYRRQLAGVMLEIEGLSATIAEAVREDEAVALLQTIPGIGVQTAAAILAEIGTLERFASANDLRGYSGLVPRVQQSGERLRYGPLTRRGNPRLRRLLILAAQHFVQSRAVKDSALYRWYVAQVFRHGRNPAKVAVARRLTTILFAMLRDRTPFGLDQGLLRQAA